MSIRVVEWSTGTVGKHAAEAILDQSYGSFTMREIAGTYHRAVVGERAHDGFPGKRCL